MFNLHTFTPNSTTCYLVFSVRFAESPPWPQGLCTGHGYSYRQSFLAVGQSDSCCSPRLAEKLEEKWWLCRAQGFQRYGLSSSVFQKQLNHACVLWLGYTILSCMCLQGVVSWFHLLSGTSTCLYMGNSLACTWGISLACAWELLCCVVLPGRRKGLCTVWIVSKTWKFWSRFNYNHQ